MEKWQYPNPQFIRKRWIDLNGEWEFCFDDEDQGRVNETFKQIDFFDRVINVPYSYHVKNSGIEDNSVHNVVWYKKQLTPTIQEGARYLLHFGAVDYKCDIWVNGCHVFTHLGGYTPFSVDITDNISLKTELIVRAKDENSSRQVIGKQSWKDHNFLCWYTRTVGIWQQVWLEETGKSYITNLRVTPDIDQASIEIDAFVNQASAEGCLRAEVSYQGELIKSAIISFKDKRARFSIDISSDEPNFRLYFWTPNTPYLYDLELTVLEGDLETDHVSSYFGMRQVAAKDQLIYLNNQEYYQKLILDQGYFKDGGLTAMPAELKDDVEKIKAMGFNGVRKHQKIEDHRFMYLCDSIGLVMWAEMPSPFEYSDLTNEDMIREVHPFIKKHYNHPSVIAYTMMNESWGINEVYRNKLQQNFVNALVYLVKSLDQTRLVVGNDGWEHTITDILTFHDYNDNPTELSLSYQDMEKVVNGSPSRTSARQAYSQGYQYQGVPVMVSEYGGIAFEKEEKKDGDAWGYGQRLNDSKEVIKRIGGLTKALMDSPGVCGFCYTQLADVEQEVNGLLDEYHQYKFDPAEIKEIMDYKHNFGFVFV